MRIRKTAKYTLSVVTFETSNQFLGFVSSSFKLDQGVCCAFGFRIQRAKFKQI